MEMFPEQSSGQFALLSDGKSHIPSPQEETEGANDGLDVTGKAIGPNVGGVEGNEV